MNRAVEVDVAGQCTGRAFGPELDSILTRSSSAIDSGAIHIGTSTAIVVERFALTDPVVNT